MRSVRRVPISHNTTQVWATPPLVPTSWSKARRLEEATQPRVQEFLGLYWVTFITISRPAGCAWSNHITFRVDLGSPGSIIPPIVTSVTRFLIKNIPPVLLYIKCHLPNGKLRFMTNFCHHSTCDHRLGHEAVTNQIQPKLIFVVFLSISPPIYALGPCIVQLKAE